MFDVVALSRASSRTVGDAISHNLGYWSVSRTSRLIKFTSNVMIPLRRDAAPYERSQVGRLIAADVSSGLLASLSLAADHGIA